MSSTNRDGRRPQRAAWNHGVQLRGVGGAACPPCLGATRRPSGRRGTRCQQCQRGCTKCGALGVTPGSHNRWQGRCAMRGGVSFVNWQDAKRLALSRHRGGMVRGGIRGRQRGRASSGTATTAAAAARGGGSSREPLVPRPDVTRGKAGKVASGAIHGTQQRVSAVVCRHGKRARAARGKSVCYCRA